MPGMLRVTDCPRCSGRGIDLAWAASGKKTCPACGGSGQQPDPPDQETPRRIARFVQAQSRT